MSVFTSRMSTTPLAAPALALAAGILCGRYTGSCWPLYICPAMCTVALFPALRPYLTRDKALGSLRSYNSRNSLWLIAIPVCAILGFLQIRAHTPADDLLYNSTYASGTVSEVLSTTGGDRLTVTTEELYSDNKRKRRIIPFKTLIYTDAASVRPGDEIMYRANLYPVDEQDAEPGYKEFLYARGIDFISPTPSDKIKVTGHSNSLQYKALEWRDKFIGHIDHTGLSPDTKGFLAAFLTGDREGLTPELRKRFAAAGVAHVLALSGLHVGILLFLLGILLQPLDLLGLRGFRLLLTALVLLLFPFFTGMGPSVIRAVIMALFVLGALALQRPGSVINSLCLAACIILFTDPRALFDAGFQLSFLCTLAILVYTVSLPVDRHNRRRMKILSLIAVPCLIFLVSWPLTAFHFHKVSVIFLPLNVPILPLLPLFTGGVIILLILTALGFEVPLLCSLIDWLYSLFARSVDYISSLEIAQAHLFPHPLVPLLGVMSALCIFYWLRVRTRPSMYAAITASCLSLTASCLLPAAVPQDTLRIPQNFDRMDVTLSYAGERQTYTLRPGTVSRLSTGSLTILFLDTRLPYGSSVPDMKADILIVSRNCDSQPDSVLAHIDPSRIILSPAIYPDMAEKWTEAALRHSLQVHFLSQQDFSCPL